MLFAGKNRQKPEQTREERSLYPILHVAGSLKEYQKELVQKEVASLWELSLVGTSFSSVLKEADHFQAKLQDLGASFSNINQTAEQFIQVRGEIAQSVSEAQGQMEELGKTSTKKYDAIEAAVCPDKRVRGLLQFYGANRTGRWAGRPAGIGCSVPARRRPGPGGEARRRPV